MRQNSNATAIKTLGITLVTISSLTALTACQKAPAKSEANANASAPVSNATTLLNVSYDVSRELYKAYNPIFASQQKQKVDIQQSHGGSSKQALSVANGLKADVVTMNQSFGKFINDRLTINHTSLGLPNCIWHDKTLLIDNLCPTWVI